MATSLIFLYSFTDDSSNRCEDKIRVTNHWFINETTGCERRARSNCITFDWINSPWRQIYTLRKWLLRSNPWLPWYFEPSSLLPWRKEKTAESMKDIQKGHAARVWITNEPSLAYTSYTRTLSYSTCWRKNIEAYQWDQRDQKRDTQKKRSISKWDAIKSSE